MAIQATATLRHLRIAPRKVRLIVGLVRGMSVNEAEGQLMYKTQRAAVPVLKLLRSAVANAVTTKSLDRDKLYIESIRVDQGRMAKRMMARARGQGVTIQKKSSHVYITLGEREDKPKSRFVIPQREVKKTAPESGGKRAKAKRGSKKEVKRGVKHTPQAIANPNISARPTGDK